MLDIICECAKVCYLTYLYLYYKLLFYIEYMSLTFYTARIYFLSRVNGNNEQEKGIKIPNGKKYEMVFTHIISEHAEQKRISFFIHFVLKENNLW